MITIKGKKYIKIKDKLVKVDHLDVNGHPVIKTRSVEKTYPDGRRDCTFIIECLQIAGRKE